MARVLAAEAAARESVALAHAEAGHIGERSRAAVRALAERTEHRVRRWRIGEEAGLRTLTQRALLDFYRAWYQPVARLAALLTGGVP